MGFLDNDDRDSAMVDLAWVQLYGFLMPASWRGVWVSQMRANGWSGVIRQMYEGSPEAIQRARGNRQFFLAQGATAPPNPGEGGGPSLPAAVDLAPGLEGMRTNFASKGVNLPSPTDPAPPPPTSPPAAESVDPGPPLNPDRIDRVARLIGGMSPYSFEPGIGTSEIKVIGAWLVGHAVVVASVLGGIGIHLDAGQVQSFLEWISGESALIAIAYAGFRSWRKRS